MMRWAALLLLTVCSWAQAAGSLVIIGGALRDNNHAVWNKVVQLAGGPGARIAVFPSAAGNPARSGEAAAARLRAAGAQAFVVPLSLDQDYLKLAEDDSLAGQVAQAGGAYFVGGDQARITQVLQREDGSPTRVLDAVWQLYQRGGVVAGSSAGAAIMSRIMFKDAGNVLNVLRDGARHGIELAPGLGFIGAGVFVDQHFLARGRFARLIPAMLASGDMLGLGVEEDSAAVVRGSALEVIGYKGVLLIDLRQAKLRREGGFGLQDARLSYLDSGDHYDLASGQFQTTRAALDPQQPYVRGPLFTADLLANGAITDLMARLVDSDQQQASGLAFDNSDPRAFRFTLRRLPSSRAYAPAGSDSGSVLDVALDITPIRFQAPE